MRVYNQPIAYTSGVSTNAIHDVYEIVPAADKPVMLLGWEIGQTSEVTDANEQQVELVLKRMLTITSGSGGTASTSANPVLHNDTQESYTFENGNTTQATATTTQELGRFMWNVRMSHLWVPIPEQRPVVAGSAHGIVLAVNAATSGSIARVAGHLIVAELA